MMYDPNHSIAQLRASQDRYLDAGRRRADDRLAATFCAVWLAGVAAMLAYWWLMEASI